MRHGGWIGKWRGAGLVTVLCTCSCLGSLEYLGDAGGAGGGSGAAGGDGAGAGSTGGEATCGDVTSDPEHCGACGHSCFGGACIDQQCQPVVVAEGQDQPFGIAVDADHVYWSNRGSLEIRRAPRKGGDHEQVAASDTSPVAFVPTYLVVTPTHVAWANVEAGQNNGYAVIAWNKTGGDPAGFADSSPDGNDGLAVSGDTFYFGNYGLQQIRSAPLGQSTSIVASGQEAPVQVAVDDTHVYWTRQLAPDGGVVRVQRQGGGEPEHLSPEVDAASGIALDDEFVYATAVNRVVRIAKAGGPALVLAEGQFQPYGIAVDEARVYWVDAGSGAGATGAVLGIAKDGSEATPTVIASGQRNPTLIALDGEQIYWTNVAADAAGAGSVMRVAR